MAAETERTIRRVAPSLRRVTKYDAATYQGRGDVCTIGVWTTFVAVGFWAGAKLARDHPLLEGRAKTTRVAKLRTPAEARTRAFAALVRAAVRLDKAEPVHPIQRR
ncbi:MAG TPA: hypothetical protein VM370_05425 [Candidatus Thermoplasmatota archaeon]|nr:hypothetical protein [Candidatus Thermoplasmatota archaeon]